MSRTRLHQAALQLAERLRETSRRVVFAESCTAGLVAASLGEVSGISEYLCGSAVVYRNATKAAWLQVSADDLDDSSIGAVSAPVAEAMAIGVLENTAEADLAASITGDLGPGAPSATDGIAYVGLADRCADGEIRLLSVDRMELDFPDHSDSSLNRRQRRQIAAAVLLLERVTTTNVLRDGRTPDSRD